MKKLSANKVKWVKILHLLVVSIWIGSGLVMGFISWVGPALLKNGIDTVYSLMKAMDMYIIMPMAIGTFITGLVFGVFTNWGFFKHRWITVKWVVLLIQMVIGSQILGPSISDNASITRMEQTGSFNNPEFLNNQFMIHLGSSIQFILLLFVVFISVLKPWKKRQA